MSPNLPRLCAWGGPAAVIISCAGWLIAGVLPLPLGPADSAVQTLRMEGRHPLLSFLQLGAGSITTVFNLVPQMMVGVIAFRPDGLTGAHPDVERPREGARPAQVGTLAAA